MRIPRIFVPHPLSSQQDLILKDPISHRLQHVLRFKVGARVLLFNGECRQDFPAVITSCERHQLSVTTEAPVVQRDELRVPLHLYQAMIKTKPMDWLIQKATELGVQQITPMYTDFTDMKKDKRRDEKNHAHWQSIMVAASEQCGRGDLPTLNPVVDFASVLKGLNPDDVCVVGAMKPPYTPWDTIHQSGRPIHIFIGPEGGLSEGEYQQLRAIKALPVCLSPMILRAETAAVVALGLCQRLES